MSVSNSLLPVYYIVSIIGFEPADLAVHTPPSETTEKLFSLKTQKRGFTVYSLKTNFDTIHII